MLKKILSSNPETRTVDEIAMTIFRVVIGLFMAFGHGLGKVPPQEGLIGGVTAMGFPAPLLFAWMAGLAEFAGGIFVALGFMTRINSFFVSFTMLVAAFIVHGADPFKIQEMSLLYLFAFLLFMIRGSGRYSLDHLLFKKA